MSYSIKSQQGTVNNIFTTIVYVAEGMIRKSLKNESFVIVTGDKSNQILIFNGTDSYQDENHEVEVALQKILESICKYKKITLNYGDEETLTFIKED